MTAAEVTPTMTPARDVAARMAAIADEVAGPVAADVDEEARFPSETLAALRAEGLLAALVPAEFGGGGATIAEVSEGVVALGRRCASSAMVVAMHHIQVACLVRHGTSDLLRTYLRELCEHQYLLASATTEVGTGGDVRSSICALEVENGRFRVEKQAPVISYADDADAVLVTARRTADSPESDQIIVLCRPPGLELEQVGEWNALGFRGTCSTGFVLRASGDADAVLGEPYADISTRTMLPTAHLLWSSVWLGIATDAIDLARTFVQAEARRRPGITPTASLRLAEATVIHQQFVDMVNSCLGRFEAADMDGDRLTSIGFGIAMNALKVSASTLVVDIVRECMLICGLASYRLDSPYSMGRHLRDAMGAALMVNNDRIMANNAQMLLVHRGE
ncbi:MAG: acyl-CoA dehydrogenase family protein [Acidimicrobiales bacterium]|jgi:acyl-CoA dehydrogenase